MRDITNDIPEFCDRCCNDDPKKRASSVELLEYLQQRMRDGRKVSSLVAEALERDADSTFWDIRIEKILEAGANTDFSGSNATLLEHLIPNTSNKTATDINYILRILSEYGVVFDSQITHTFLRTTSTMNDMSQPRLKGRSAFDMEGVLAVLGGVSALTELIHCSSSSFSIAVAFPRIIRCIGHKIDELVQQLLAMTKTIDDILESIRFLYAHISRTSSFEQLLDQYRKDTMSLRLLLEVNWKKGPEKKPSNTTGDRNLLNQKELEDLLPSYRRSLGLITSYFAT
jgi:serine/threonine protein kinase